VDNRAREEEWAMWLRAAICGDTDAYRQFLEAVTSPLRAMARRRCERFGTLANDVEDIVQEVLLAIHLKRGTWDQSRPIGPWISAMVRNKLVDTLRRRGRHISVPIEDIIDTFEAEERSDGSERQDVEQMLGHLKARQRDIVRSISLEGTTVRETADRLNMSEVAVRVALHRALKALAVRFRSDFT
jgi:RNA polymerase sigma factor (sigma-70 family)